MASNACHCASRESFLSSLSSPRRAFVASRRYAHNIQTETRAWIAELWPGIPAVLESFKTSAHLVVDEEDFGFSLCNQRRRRSAIASAGGIVPFVSAKSSRISYANLSLEIKSCSVCAGH